MLTPRVVAVETAVGAVLPVAVALAGSNLLRPLPALYSTASAIAYSPYRSCGPPCGEVPSNADILQDLSLLSKAGFTLLRNYASDSVGANIVALAAANYPTLKFQLGVYLDATSSACVDSSGNNASQIANAIAKPLRAKWVREINSGLPTKGRAPSQASGAFSRQSGDRRPPPLPPQT